MPIDAIGLQSHQHQGAWGKDRLAEVIERFSGFGLPLHFTENTFVSGDLMPPHIVDLNDYQVDSWPSTPAGEERQARDVEEMLDLLFASPSVTALTSWNLVDGQWLKAPAGVLREDGGKKPAFEVYRQRVQKDWRTETTLQTDENGVCTLTGFRGAYALKSDQGEGVFTPAKETGALTLTIR